MRREHVEHVAVALRELPAAAEETETPLVPGRRREREHDQILEAERAEVLVVELERVELGAREEIGDFSALKSPVSST
jgi:hypothetical protein